MRVASVCEDANEREYVLSKAILVYKDRSSSETVFASVHDIVDNKGVPTIAAGLPVTKKGLKEMMATLNPQEKEQPALLDQNLLAKGDDYLVWYCPPQERQVWFKCKELGEVTAKVSLPGIVFAVAGNEWFVFATKGDGRPTAETELFVAPLFNVWHGGRICVGNIDIPKRSNRYQPKIWEKSFWESNFTHPNIHEKGALTAHRGGPFGLWRALLKGKKFPQSSLVTSGETLGQMFKRVVMNHG